MALRRAGLPARPPRHLRWESHPDGTGGGLQVRAVIRALSLGGRTEAVYYERAGESEPFAMVSTPACFSVGARGLSDADCAAGGRGPVNHAEPGSQVRR